MIELRITVTAIAISAACSFTAGVWLERLIWEKKDMGALCAEGRDWACRLHPQCSMQSLVCFPNPADITG